MSDFDSWSAGAKVPHREFPGGPPSEYCTGPTMLNFSDLTRTGGAIVVWWYLCGGGGVSQRSLSTAYGLWKLGKSAHWSPRRDESKSFFQTL